MKNNKAPGTRCCFKEKEVALITYQLPLFSVSFFYASLLSPPFPFPLSVCPVILCSRALAEQLKRLLHFLVTFPSEALI